MFYLSGTINVVLFLIIRPGLLLFPRPKRLDEPDVVELVPEPPQGDAGPAFLPGAANVQRSPERNLAALGDEGPMDGAMPPHVNPRRMQDDIEI